ncbi:hypothetical protein ACP76Z_02570 [Vibrio cholerae]
MPIKRRVRFGAVQWQILWMQVLEQIEKSDFALLAVMPYLPPPTIGTADEIGELNADSADDRTLS